MKALPTLLAMLSSVALSQAGTSAASKMATPITEVEQFGQITIGGKFAEDLNSGYAAAPLPTTIRTFSASAWEFDICSSSRAL
jgi:hypothetical protein